MNNLKCSKNCLTLGIPEASRFDTSIAEMGQMQSCDEQHPTGSTCATVTFSLRLFGRKGMIVKKSNVNEIFTHDTVSLARCFSDAVAVFHHRLNLW